MTTVRLSLRVVTPALRGESSRAPFSTCCTRWAKAAPAKAGKAKAGGPAEANAPPPKPKAEGGEVYDASQDTSSAPAGTVLTGLSIFKDRPEPVARPDSHYPPWLWEILGSKEDASATPISLAAELAGMAKGEARVAEKRLMKARRAAQRAKEAAAKKSFNGVGMRDVAQEANAPIEIAEGSVEEAAALASLKLDEQAPIGSARDPNTGMTERERLEVEKKKALRKASRSTIKAKNFVSSS